MKVTFVLPILDLSGGVRVCASLAQGLQARGHEVVVVARPWPADPLRSRIRARLTGSRLLSQSGSHFDGVRIERRILDSIRPVVDSDLPPADVVIATWWETAEWVAPFSPEKGSKVYFIQQWEANLGGPEERVAATWRLPMPKIVISEWLANLARDRFGDAEVTVMEPGIDTSLFQAPPRRKRAVPTIGFMHSLSPAKGLNVSLQAIEHVRRALPETRVVAFGAYHPTDEVPLPPGCDFVLRPRQPQIPEVYRSCDVWLCSSFSEGFHLPPMEAMACRTPVVSTRVGGPTDIVQPGANGFLVEPGDAEGLAKWVLHVLRMDDTAWREMSANAYNTAMRYTWDRSVRIFEKALMEAVAQHRHACAVNAGADGRGGGEG